MVKIMDLSNGKIHHHHLEQISYMESNVQNNSILDIKTSIGNILDSNMNTNNVLDSTTKTNYKRVKIGDSLFRTKYV